MHNVQGIYWSTFQQTSIFTCKRLCCEQIVTLTPSCFLRGICIEHQHFNGLLYGHISFKHP